MPFKKKKKEQKVEENFLGIKNPTLKLKTNQLIAHHYYVKQEGTEYF